MTTHHEVLKRITQLGLLLLLGVGISACGNSTSWKEEVLLHDGSKIIIEQYVDRGGRHEIGQKPPYKEQSLNFTMPGSNESVMWKDSYSEDLGMANFLPMALDIRAGIAYLGVKPMGCLSYNKWGRPNPPYVIFKYQGKEWKRILLQELPAEIKAPNLIGSSPDTEVKKSGKNFFYGGMDHGI
ncbi:MAG: hypothetical protein ABL860_09300 [Candidatus Nitrotoga sp.]